jgi:DNA-binding NarL/FixJ family response regulator
MKLAIIDDHSLIRSGVSSALANTEFEVIAEASSVKEGAAVINSFKPDICLVDVNLGAGNGINLIKQSIATGIRSKFVVLTMHDDSETLELAKEAGAAAYVTKSVPIEQLIQVLYAVAESKTFIRRGEIQAEVTKKDFGLTVREVEVLSHLPTGATAAVIAGILFLTEATVKTHLAAIYRKLGAANRAQAVSIGIENKLISKQ